MNALSTIAEAVKTALASAPAGTFSIAPASIERVYVPPDYETAADDSLRVLVIAFEEDLDIHGPNSTRRECDHLYGVKVAMLKRVAAADVTSPAALAELDGLSDVRQELIDFLKANRVMGDGQLDALKNTPAAYDPPTLDQKKTFVSVLALTYRLLR